MVLYSYLVDLRHISGISGIFKHQRDISLIDLDNRQPPLLVGGRLSKSVHFSTLSKYADLSLLPTAKYG